MGGIGGWNPCPFEVGGGTSGLERIYRALRKAVGGSTGAGPEGGIEDLWRICKAEAIWASLEAEERAALQALPLYASDHLPVYEDALMVPRAETDAERAEAITLAFVLQLAADIPNIRQELQRIDPQVDVVPVLYDQTTLVHFGKHFGPRPGASGPPYGSGQSASITASAWPNYATDFILHVRYTLLPGQIEPPAEKMAQIARHLCEVLPSWVDFNLYSNSQGDDGFYLDGGPNDDSFMDLTGFE